VSTTGSRSAPPGVIWPKDRSVRSADGARITYTFVGPADGPVVALCSGLLCPDTFWHHLVPELAEAGHRVLLFHYRGIATSGLPEPDHVEAHTIARCADDLRAIVEAESIGALALVAHSMGLQVALEAHRLLGDRVRGLVSITGTFASPLQSLYGRGPLITIGLYHPLRVALEHLPAGARRRLWRAAWSLPALELGRLLHAFGPLTPDEVVQSYLDHAGWLDPGVVVRIVAGMHAHDARDHLGSVDVPSLVIAGGRDPLAPPAVTRGLVEALPDARLRVVPEGTHGTILEFPGLVGGWVREHLAHVAPPR
jgi:pimeloyl-ACP methyl ester carboxylesterase